MLQQPVVSAGYWHSTTGRKQARTGMGYNWGRFYSWDKHPMLNNNLRFAVPGLKWGVGAFALYVAYDQIAHSGKKAHH